MVDSIQHIHSYEQNPRLDEPEQNSAAPAMLRGGEEHLLKTLSAYLKALRTMWRLFTTGRVDHFRRALYSKETGEFLYPETATLIAQTSMADHDVLLTHIDQKIEKLTVASDFMARKKLLTLANRLKNEHVQRSALSDDFHAVALPAVKLHLQSINDLVNTAFRWVSTPPEKRVEVLRGLRYPPKFI